MATVGEIQLDVGLTPGSQAKVAGQLGTLGAAGGGVGKKFGTGFLGAATKAIPALVAAFGAIKVGSFLKEAVVNAGDLEQSIGAVNAIFKDGASEMHKYSKNATQTLGLTKNQYNESASLLGSLLKNLGAPMETLSGQTNDLMGLAADFAAMYGGTTKEAVEAITSLFKGERNPIERYAISINETTLKAHALAEGFIKTTKDARGIKVATTNVAIAQQELNEAIKKHGEGSTQAAKAQNKLSNAEARFEKVSAGKLEQMDSEQKMLATQSLLYKQGADSIGQYAKESDTLQGRQKLLNAEWGNMKENLGMKLLPIVSTFIGYLNENLPTAFEKIKEAWKGFEKIIEPLVVKLREELPGAIEWLKKGWEALKTAALPVIERIKESFSGIIEQYQEIWEKHGPKFIMIFKAVGLLIAGAFMVGLMAVLAFVKVWSFMLKISDLVWTVIGAIGSAFVWLWEKAVAAWNGIYDFFASLHRVPGDLKIIFLMIFDYVTAPFKKAWAWLKGLPGSFRTAGSNLMVSIRNGITERIRALYDAFTKPIVSTIDWFKKLPDTFKTLGKNLFQGFINGLAERAAKLRDAIVNPVKNAWKETKNFLGIRSPSRLYQKMGSQTMQGYEKGVDSEARNVTSSVVDGISGAFRAADKLSWSAPSSPAVEANNGSTSAAPTSVESSGGVTINVTADTESLVDSLLKAVSVARLSTQAGGL